MILFIIAVVFVIGILTYIIYNRNKPEKYEDAPVYKNIPIKLDTKNDNSYLIWEESEFVNDNWPDLDFHIDEKKKIFNMALNLPLNKSIIDIGAHIGDLALPLAKALINSGRDDIIVYAIDPSKDKCEFITKISDMNNIYNLVVLNCGFANENKILNHGSLGHKNTGATMWGNVENSTESGIFYTADHLFLQGIIKNVGIYHIDVENMETELIEGSKTLIDECKPILLIEAWDDKDNCDFEKHKNEKDKCLVMKVIEKNHPDYIFAGYMPNKDLIYMSRDNQMVL